MANGTIAASQLDMLSQDGTGIATIVPPATNTNRTLTLPDATTTLVGTNATQTLTNKTLQSSTIQGGTITSGTAVTASGTSVDFTDIPSWVKRITVMFSGVSTNGTSQPYLRLGDAGGFEDTGYVSGVGSISTAANTTSGSITVTEAFPLYTGATVALASINGNLILSKLSGNIWTASATLLSGQRTTVMGGSKELSDTLTQVRITTANGTDTFDAGTINILYEG